MKKLTLAALISATLVGCGGSDNNDDSTPSPVTTNTPPTLSGTLTYEVKAAAEYQEVLNLADADGDTVSVSVAEQPDWLSTEVANSQLTLTLAPGFFDIGEHAVTLQVSDGKASVDYQLTLTVADNPDKWQDIALGDGVLEGLWTNPVNGNSLAFTESNNGVMTDDNGDIHHFSYEVSDTGFTTDIKKYACLSCTEYDWLEFEVVAQEQDKIRVVLSTDETETVMNLTKTVQPELQHSYFFIDEPSSYYGVGHLEPSADKASLPVFYARIKGKDFNSTAINTQIEGNQLVLSELSEDFYSSFHDIDYNYVDLFFTHYIDGIKVLAQTEQGLAIELLHHNDLKAESQGISLLNPSELEDALMPQADVLIYSKVDKISAPALATGASYSGRFITEATTVGEEEYLIGGTVLTLESATKATTHIYSPKNQQTEERTLTLTQGADVLAVNDGTTTTEYSFFSNGEITWAARYFAESESYLAYPFMEVDTNLASANTLSDVIGIYQHQDAFISLDMKDTTNYMWLHGGGFGNYSELFDYQPSVDDFYSGRDLWKLDEQGRIQFISSYYCPTATSYDECYTETLATPEAMYFMRSLRPLHSEAGQTVFSYSFAVKSGASDYSYQSLRILNKVE
ncbi:hypothetical protein [Pseudoalteromonas sp. T1lg75]|uniref:hypothetical protein n=1 Tax=Pseudoalteromonas sp. T1lg75 TaxID=2077102 RepID=UPI000CF5E8CE|nr:hypothetical protein [Pseudoalteromonas sp. T1lg75]